MSDAAAYAQERRIKLVMKPHGGAAVFGTLKAAGFAGPVMVECCKVGATAVETMGNARANRLFLEKVLALV